MDMDEGEEYDSGHLHDHGHESSHNCCDYNEGMDEEETGDSSLNKLNSILKEYGVDSIFPPLDGTALYSMMCKINHSCSPNVRVKYVFTREHGLVAELVALREIQPDEELVQSYIDQTMGKCLLQVSSTSDVLLSNLYHSFCSRYCRTSNCLGRLWV